MSRITDTVEKLTTVIGPRPVASDTERTAAEWLYDRFKATGLAAEIQDFIAVRSVATARIISGLVCCAAVAAIGTKFMIRYYALQWTCWLVLAIVAVLLVLDMLGKRGLAGMLTKGPSQNVIARHVPQGFSPGTAPQRIVLVAHYDTGLASPLTAESVAFLQRPLSLAANLITAIAPLYTLAIIFLRKAATVQHWVWIVGMVITIIPLLLALNELFAKLFKRFSPGANNNASGVAAMLAVAERLTGVDPDSADDRKARTSGVDAPPAPPVVSTGGGDTRGEEYVGRHARGGGGTGPQPVDFAQLEAATQSGPIQRDMREAQILSFETVEFGQLDTSAPPVRPMVSRRGQTGSLRPVGGTGSLRPVTADPQDTLAFSPIDDYDASSTFAEVPATSDVLLDADIVGTPVDVEGLSGAHGFGDDTGRAARRSGREKGGLFGRLRDRKGAKQSRGGRGAGQTADDDPSNWLGLDHDFNARTEGAKIGSWDNFGGDDDADGFAWKGGRAAGDVIEDGDYAAIEAARIRRRVAENYDMNMAEKEVWFVATGASFSANAGMKEFIGANADALRGALIVNLQALGAGDLYWTTKERAAGTHATSARLTSLARRVSRETETRIKALRTRSPRTDAALALAAGFRAMSIMRLTAKGVPFAWTSPQDTAARIDASAIEEAAGFVSALIHEA
ncbi:MAG: hypothetical protein LBS17_02725 [Actinomycetes bacterium]|jgi:hypothetical protein|nr:hypothetical protein [Actinomycetes bacterium]